MEDISQFSVSDEGKEIINFLIDNNWFNSQQTAIKFAVAVAISASLDTTQNKAQYITAQHVGGLDKDGSLARLITEIFPGKQPYKYAQILCDEGLKYISKKIQEDKINLDYFIK